MRPRPQEIDWQQERLMRCCRSVPAGVRRRRVASFTMYFRQLTVSDTGDRELAATPAHTASIHVPESGDRETHPGSSGAARERGESWPVCVESPDERTAMG